jgi:hypothetical protein
VRKPFESTEYEDKLRLVETFPIKLSTVAHSNAAKASTIEAMRKTE